MKKIILALIICFVLSTFIFLFGALAQDSVEPVCTVGEPGQWQIIGNLPGERANFAMIQTDKYVFIIGGNGVTTTLVTTATEQLGSEWQTTSPISDSLTNSAVTFSGEYVFVLGGYGSGYDAMSVISAHLGDNGQLGAWQNVNPMNYKRIAGKAISVGDYLYAIGGDYEGSVERTTVQTDGSLGTWELTHSLNTPRTTGMAVASNSTHVYVIGGQSNGATKLDSVEVASINQDGTLGEWQLSGSRMNLSRAGLQAAIVNGYLYAIGGSPYNGITNAYDLVERARINDDGTLGAWQYVSRMITPRRGFGTAVVGNKLYAIGGNNTSNILEGLDSIEAIDLTNAPQPADYGLTINDGAIFTNQVSVTLTIGQTAPWTDLVEVSNDGGFAGATWQTYNPCKAWTITRYGNYIIPRTVYVRFKNPTTGQLSATFSDDIILDVTAPTGSVAVDSLTAAAAVNAAGVLTGQTVSTYTVYLPLLFRTGQPQNATIRLTASDDVSGVGYMMVANNPGFTGSNWEAFQASQNWYVPEGGAIYVKYKDYAGNVSAVYSAQK